MKKAVKKIVCAFSILCVLFTVSVAVVPTFAETDVLTDDNHYGVDIWDYDTDQALVDAYNGAMDYTFVESLSQIFFDLFPLSDIKTIIPVERYTTDENGKHSIVQAPLPVEVPLSFSLNSCAVMAIRINISGTMYGMWSYAENFEVVTNTNLYGYEGDGIIDEPSCFQHIAVNYDVISFGDSILSDLEQYYPKDSAWMNRYWDKAEHLEYRGGFGWNIGLSLLSEYAYDTMREYDANSKNYTLAYAVVSLEDFSTYNHKEDALQEGYNLGYYNGNAEGYENGYTEGQAYGESLHADDWQYGYDIGYMVGVDDGQEASNAYYNDYWSAHYNTEAYGNAVQEAIRSEDSNPVTAFFNSIWNGILNACETVSNGVSVGGISLGNVIVTLVVAAVVIFVVRMVI